MRFEISGNPSTGYKWMLDEDAMNGAFTVTQTFKYDSAPPGYMGVGGKFIFEVKAGSVTGKGNFSISNRREWEAANMALGAVSIPISVLA